jgi:hypothetical protein
MNPEEKELLRRSLLLSEENNKILRGLQRSQRWSSIWGFIKFLIVIVPLVIGYLFLQPYLGSILSNYQVVQGMIDSSKSTNSSATTSGFKNMLIEKFGNNF